MGMWSMTFDSHRCSKRMKYGYYKIKYWEGKFQDYVIQFVRLLLRRCYSFAKDFHSDRNTNLSFPLCIVLNCSCYDHRTTAVCLGNTPKQHLKSMKRLARGDKNKHSTTEEDGRPTTPQPSEREADLVVSFCTLLLFLPQLPTTGHCGGSVVVNSFVSSRKGTTFDPQCQQSSWRHP